MNRLILDHFRRKAWILVFGALLELAVGISFGAFAAHPGDNSVASLQLQIGVFMGSFLLFLDLKNGLARTVVTLPLTARQIGRAWWLATVGIPAAAALVLLITGAALFCLFRPETSPPWAAIGLSAFTLLLWMGSAFPLIFALTSGADNTRRRVLKQVMGAFWGLMVGGGFWFKFLQDQDNHPLKFAVFVAAGTTLTIIGWFRAEQLVLGRANFQPATHAGDRGEFNAVLHRPGGLGGLPLLVIQTCTRAFLMGLAMIVAMPLIAMFQGRPQSWTQIIESISGAGFVPFWLILFIALTPALLQLRLLRTLPISTTRLAAVLMTMAILPLTALTALTGGLTGAVLGADAALVIAKAYLVTLAPAALAVFFVTWRGLGKAAYLLMFILVLGSQFATVWFKLGAQHEGLSLGWMVVVVTSLVALAFGLTRLALQRGTLAYRTPTTALANAWGAGR